MAAVGLLELQPVITVTVSEGDEQEPVLVDFKQKTPVSKGYDMFVASDKNRSGCEAISVWIAAQAAAQPQADASIISKVLSKIF